MRLIVITPPQTAPAEHRLVEDLFAEGLRALHVRKPAAAEAEVQAYLQQIPHQHSKAVVLHASSSFDAAPLASKSYLGGIHYPERLRPRTCTRQPALTASTALHSLQDLRQDFGELDYVFLSPIFDSISKSGYTAAFCWDDLRPALAGSRYPVVALGGVTAARVRDLKDAGFAGIAVIGAVWEAADPLAAYQELQDACLDVS